MLKKSAVPHIFPWSKQPTEATQARNDRAKRKLLIEEEVQRKKMRLEEEKARERDTAMLEVGAEENVVSSNCTIESGLLDGSSQTDSVKTQCVVTQTEDFNLFSARRFATDPEGIHYYTGLECYEKFKMVLHTLGPAAYELNYYHGVTPTLSVENQFFLTLVKLRQHKTNFEISRMFGVTEASVTNIFVTWVNFMALQWGEVEWWPSRDLVDFYMPTDFKVKFPTTRVIVDGTECPVKKPKEPILQQATWSTYKNRNTVKVLVGISPGGLVSYVSPAYAGSASDRNICERSELPQMCEPQDSVMADKGFNVQDLFEASMVAVNIPTFFSKKNRMSGKTVLKDRRIANKRVHIERIIGLAKTYKILQQPMNNTESGLATQIIHLCFYLCNFRANIVPKDA